MPSDHEANARRARGLADSARERERGATRRATEAAHLAQIAGDEGSRRRHERDQRTHAAAAQLHRRAAELQDEHAEHEHAQAVRDDARET